MLQAKTSVNQSLFSTVSNSLSTTNYTKTANLKCLFLSLSLIDDRLLLLPLVVGKKEIDKLMTTCLNILFKQT